MKVLGVDCNTKFIACIQLENNGVVKVSTVGSEEKDDFEIRLETFLFCFQDLLDTFEPDVVYLEGPIYLQNPKTSFMIARVIDMVYAACILKSVPRFIVDNKSWKKDILGSGNASKTQIMEFAKARWGEYIIKNQDIADAAAIALYGWRRMASGD